MSPLLGLITEQFFHSPPSLFAGCTENWFGCIQRKGTAMTETEEAHRRAKVRRLNDRLRCHGVGNGSLFLTAGIHDRGKEFQAKALNGMRRFDNFTKDNDPHEEHDFGAFDLEGERLFWKIDYYGPDMQRGSDDPCDEEKTHRVLTIMLASEY